MGEVEVFIKVDKFIHFDIFVNFDFIVNFDIFLNFDFFVNFDIFILNLTCISYNSHHYDFQSTKGFRKPTITLRVAHIITSGDDQRIASDY